MSRTIERVHERLEAIFLAHQDALVRGDLEGAQKALARYRAGLEQHIQDEETHLLPRYDAAAHPRRWQADVFVAEHRKLLELLGELEVALGPLNPASESWPRALVVVLEAEATLKGVAEHHHAREEQALFPTLAKTLGEAAWAELAERCDFEP